MIINLDWLHDHRACHSSIAWFEEHFPEGAERNDILLELNTWVYLGRYDWYNWLLKQTLKEESLPDDWVFLTLKYLDLGGGTLQKYIRLPDSLRTLYLGGGRIECDLPIHLKRLSLEGGTVADWVTIPKGCDIAAIFQFQRPLPRRG